MELFDDRHAILGEGPLWHPGRAQAFWFDILGNRLLSRSGTTQLEWQFGEHVSAAGWIDEAHLLIASETQLFEFNIDTGFQTHLHPLEKDNSATRSNDGRADPWGGFWIGTMGKNHERAAGAIYRYYDGRVHRLFKDISISNAICFDAPNNIAYFSDSARKKIFRQKIDTRGFPSGEPSIFLDLKNENLIPDGAIIDEEGHMWCAHWGSYCINRYTPNGECVQSIETPMRQPSCPAFVGEDRKTLLVTSARTDIKSPSEADGQTWQIKIEVPGRLENRVILPHVVSAS